MQCSTREGHWRSVCFCCHLFPVQCCTVQDKPRLPTPSPGRTACPPPLPAEHPRTSLGLDPPSPPRQGKNPTANQENQEDGSSASSPPRRHLWQLKPHQQEIPALCFPRSFLQLSQVWSEFILNPDQHKAVDLQDMQTPFLSLAGWAQGQGGAGVLTTGLIFPGSQIPAF